MKVKSVSPSLGQMPKVSKSEIPISSFIPIDSCQQISLILKKPLLCFY